MFGVMLPFVAEDILEKTHRHLTGDHYPDTCFGPDSNRLTADVLITTLLRPPNINDILSDF